MGRPERIHIPGRIHHVMARGNGGQAIFTQPNDWHEFTTVLASVKRTSDFSLHAYCLMPNHFHLLLKTGNDPLSKFMQRIQTAWSKHFNIARQRKGHVFQDRFKSLPCDNDTYLKWLLRYIHLNPVHAGLVDRPELWPWSSYREYLTPQTGQLSDSNWPLSLFGSNKHAALASFCDFVLSGIGKEEKPLPLIDSRMPTPPMDQSVEWKARLPDIHALVAHAASEHAVKVGTLLHGCRKQEACAARRSIAARAVASGYRVNEIAFFLGVSPSAVSRMLRSAAKIRESLNYTSSPSTPLE